MNEQLGFKYCSAIHGALRLYAAWPFGTELEVGDYGRLTGDLFIREGHITDIMPIQLSTDEVPANLEFNYSSEGVETSNAGATAAGGGTELTTKVTFAKNESIYFRSIKLRQRWLKGFHQLASEIMKTFKDGKWEGQWVFIHSLFKSDGTTVLINNSEGAYIEFRGSSSTVGALDIADAQLGVTMKTQRNVGFKAIADVDRVPLFELSKVRPRYRLLPFTKKNVYPLSSGRITGSSGGNIPGELISSFEPEVSLRAAQALSMDVDELYHVAPAG